MPKKARSAVFCLSFQAKRMLQKRLIPLPEIKLPYKKKAKTYCFIEK